MHQRGEQQVHRNIGNDLPVRVKHLAEDRVGLTKRQQVAARQMIRIVGERRDLDGDDGYKQGGQHERKADPPSERAIQNASCWYLLGDMVGLGVDRSHFRGW
jgi:hypothetical protein